jgi:hypothetical protein
LEVGEQLGGDHKRLEEIMPVNKHGNVREAGKDGVTQDGFMDCVFESTLLNACMWWRLVVGFLGGI